MSRTFKTLMGLILFVQVGCFETNDYSKYGPFEGEVRDFVATAHQHGMNVNLGRLNIKLVSILNGTPILGVCIPEDKTIIINESFWMTADNAEKEFLVFHEMGHCVLGREHSTWIHEGMPVSIMYPMEWATQFEPYYWLNRNKLMDELFNPFQGKLGEIKTLAGVDDTIVN